MEYQTILTRVEGAISTITMNRPDRKNALTMQMISELHDAVMRAAADDEIRVVILTGAGDAFCSGADFRYRELKAGKVTTDNAEELRPLINGMKRGKLSHELTDTIMTLHGMGKPTISMVPGDAVGAGFDLALACDIRMGSPKTRFMVGFTRIGLPPDTGTAWFLPRIVGVNQAVEIILTGDFVSGEEAFRLGILNHLASHDKLEAETLALAQKLARGAPVAHRLAKKLIYDGLSHDLPAALDDAMAYVTIGLGTSDHHEGIAAFAEKRPPVFKDK